MLGTETNFLLKKREMKRRKNWNNYKELLLRTEGKDVIRKGQYDKKKRDIRREENVRRNKKEVQKEKIR